MNSVTKARRNRQRKICVSWCVAGLLYAIPSFADTVQKPLPYAPINWNSPLSAGLISSVAVNEGSGSTFYDAAANQSYSAVSLSGSPVGAAAPTWINPSVTPDYPWAGPAISNNHATAKAIQTPSPFVIPANTTGYSYAVLVEPLDTTTFGRIMDGTGAAVVTSYINLQPGTVSTTWRNSSNVAINPQASVATNKWSLVLFTVQDGLGVVYVNGVQVTSSTAVNLANSVSNQSGQLSFNTTGNGGAMANANFSSWWIWNNRVLTASDAAQMYANPWAMFTTPNPVIALTATAPASGFGNQLVNHALATTSDRGVFSPNNPADTLSTTKSSGSYAPGAINFINSQGTGDVAGITGDASNYVEVGGFSPATDTELFGLKLDATVNGVSGALAPDSDAVKTIVADINTTYGSTTASALSAFGIQGNFTGYDILLSFNDNTPGFTPNGFLDFNFSGYANPQGINGVNVSNVTVTDIVAVPEPASGLAMILCGGALLGAGRVRVWRPHGYSA